MTFANRDTLREHLSSVHMLPCCWSDCKQSFTNANALRKHLDSHVSQLENEITMTAVMIVRQAAMRGSNADSNENSNDGSGVCLDDNDHNALTDPSMLLDTNLGNKISNDNYLTNGNQDMMNDSSKAYMGSQLALSLVNNGTSSSGKKRQMDGSMSNSNKKSVPLIFPTRNLLFFISLLE